MKEESQDIQRDAEYYRTMLFPSDSCGQYIAGRWQAVVRSQELFNSGSYVNSMCIQEICPNDK